MLIPVSLELPADELTPVSAYRRLASAGRRSFLLEGVEGGERSSRYCYLGIDPVETLSIEEGELSVEAADGGKRLLPGNPFHRLGQHLAANRSAPDASLPPFSGGAVGYLGYECFRYLEKLPAPLERVVPHDARVMVFRTIAALDGVKHRVVLVSHYDPQREGAAKGQQAALRELERLREESVRRRP